MLSKDQLKARDLEIQSLVHRGQMSRTRIGQRFHITSQRVKQIMDRLEPNGERPIEAEVPVALATSEVQVDLSRPRPTILDRLELLEGRLGYLCDMLGVQLPHD